MIVGIQILGIIFGFFMVYFTFLHYKRGEFKKLHFSLWEAIWICFILVVTFPQITNGVVHKLGVESTMDFLTIIGFMFFAFIAFYNYSNLQKIKNNLEQKIREEALKDLKK